MLPRYSSYLSSGLVLDFTSIGPDSGGVGVVAAGTAQGLHDLGEAFSCAVDSNQLSNWALRHPTLEEHLVAVKISLSSTSAWQRLLRRHVPRRLLPAKLLGGIRSRRARSAGLGMDQEVVWQPFHRSPLTSDKGVVTVHDLRVFEEGLTSLADQKIVADNIRRAAAVVCSWAHPYQALVERFPFAREKTFLISLPVLNPGSKRTRRNPNQGTIRLLTPGFITPHKNQEVVVRALAMIPNAVAVFTGTEDTQYGDKLRALASELGVSQRIEWRGFIDTRELEDEYLRADLLVMPTRWEAASGPVFEAIARHLPFVASNIAPIRSQLETISLEAELFDCDSPEGLVSAIDATLSDYGSRVDQLAKAAGPIVDRTWTQLAAEYKQVFDFAAGHSARPSELMIGVPSDPGL